MKKMLLYLLLLLPTWAKPSTLDVARIVAMRGDVMAHGITMTQGDQVQIGDHIITGIKSFAVLEFNDGSRITIRPDTEMIIDKYQYPGDDSVARFELVSGGLRIVTGALAKEMPEKYNIQTPTALMGVRGTEFSMEYLSNE